MRCLHFSNGEKKHGSNTRKSVSAPARYASNSTSNVPSSSTRYSSNSTSNAPSSSSRYSSNSTSNASSSSTRYSSNSTSNAPSSSTRYSSNSTSNAPSSSTRYSSNSTSSNGPSNSTPNGLSSSSGMEVRRSGSESTSQSVSSMSSESLGRGGPFPNLSERPNSLKVFTFPELKTATKNFSRSAVLGEGGFGCVYKGIIRSSEEPYKKIEVAVKQLGKRGFQGPKEWVTEVNVLGVVEHPNLVKLVGYCAEDDERGIQLLLVYEYMPKRSVEDHLSTRLSTPLPWDRRLKIAHDAACGLAYLHEEMDFQIIFRDFKSSNILLDDQWNAKLSDFGLARQGPSEGASHVSTAVVGTIGYAAPEYIQTGRLTCKSDVWSYGVFLYELITGRRPLDRNRPKNEQKLLEWIRPYLADTKKFELIIDSRLEGVYSLRSALLLAAVANKCLTRHPKSRPKMSEVSKMVKKIIEAKEVGSPDILIKTLHSNKASKESRRKRFSLRKKIGESRFLFWRDRKPKMARTP